MTVLLVLLFLIIALSVDAFVQHKKKVLATQPKTVTMNGIIQEIFEHDDLCPTMADGGTKIEEVKKSK